MRVLVAEDEELIRDTVAFFLEDLGFEVTSVPGADAAKQELLAGPFDLILTDVRMPGVDGFQLLDHVRRTYPHIPVILMSGWYEDIDSAQHVRPRLPVLHKPFSLEALAKALQAATALIDRDLVRWASQDVSSRGPAPDR